MAIATIDKWLADPQRKYDLGRQLYDLYGDNKLLKALLASGHDGSHYHFTRLNDALKEVNLKVKPDVPNVQHPSIPTFKKIPKLEDIPLPSKRENLTDAEWLKLPDTIKDLYNRVYRLHPHSQLLFNQCRITENKSDRLQLDLMIIRERDEINKIWKLIKDYHENGVVKEKVEIKEKTKIDELSIGELIKLSKNLPTYLSKDREKLKTMPDGQQKNKVLNRIMEREVQFDLVKKRLEANV